MSSKTLKNVILEEGQHEHFEKMAEILNSFYFAIDLSVMGSGKTYITSKLFQHFNFKNMVVICPKTIVSTWEKVREIYGLNFATIGKKNDINGIITYEAFRGMKEGVLNSGLLEKTKVIIEGENKNKIETEFFPTRKLDSLIRSGCLFVFDEFQKTKSEDTSTHNSVKALITRVRELCDEEGVDSRIILNTGTMFCKVEQVLSFIKLIGIQENEKLYTNYRDGFKTRNLGFEEIYKYAQKLDSDLTGEVYQESLTSITKKGTIKRNKISAKNIKNVVFKLYTKVIQNYVTSAMSPFIPPEGIFLDCKNEYFILSEERSSKLSKALTDLSRATRYNNQTGKIFDADKPSLGMGKIIKSLMALEHAKLEIFIRKSIEDLEEDENCKICLIFNYLSSIKIAKEILKDYRPLILCGDVKLEDREKLVNKYNRPNSKYRLLIGQFIVCSLGINLHDTDGNFPRKAYISPNYRAMDTHQVTYRFFRRGVKSTPEIRYVYAESDVDIREQSILDAYAKKTEVFEETLTSQTEGGVIFPGQYEKITEEEINFPYIEYDDRKIVFKSKRKKTLSQLITEVQNSLNIEEDEE
jgi:hypothetical protein